MKRGTTTNEMAAEMAAALGTSPQCPGILRRGKKDQAAEDQIIVTPSVKAHSRMIRDSWSGKKKDRTGTYKERGLKDMGVNRVFNNTAGTKVPPQAVCTPLAIMAMPIPAITTAAEGTITMFNLWRRR